MTRSTLAPVERRTVLRTLALTLAYFIARPAIANEDPVIAVVAKLSRYISIRRLGSFYESVDTGRRTLASLTDEIYKGLAKAGLDATDKHLVFDSLRHLIPDDFAANRTLLIDGWLLSETEVRLCIAASVYYRQWSVADLGERIS